MYGPVGFLQPLTVKLKLLFQCICRSRIGCNDPIGKSFYKKGLNVVEVIRMFIWRDITFL